MDSLYDNLFEVEEEVINGNSFRVYKNRPKTIIEMLEKAAAKFPNKEAFYHEGRSLSYADAMRLVNNVAHNLGNKYKVGKSDRVAILLGNNIHFPLIFYGIVRCGAIGVPLNTNLVQGELLSQIKNSNSSVIVTEPALYQKISDCGDIKGLPVICTENVDGTFPITTIYRDVETSLFPGVDLTETDPLAIIYTSGTTGAPKGVILTHIGYINAVIANDKALAYTSEGTILITMPMFHVAGIGQFLSAHLFGMRCVILRFETEKVLETLQREKITYWTGSPTMFLYLLETPSYRNYSVHSLKNVMYGAAPMPVYLIHRLKKELPNTNFVHGYGMTETHSLNCSLPPELALIKPNSVGYPIPILEFRIMKENGQLGKIGEKGEINIKGITVTPGYWQNEEETRKAIVDGWLFTGDVGHFDEDGCLYIVDRTKDMINRGGENIYCIEIENILYSHAKILEAAVVGVADRIYGEEVKACIVAKPGCVITEEEILNFCKGKIAKYKIPRIIEFYTQLPRNPSGKIMKAQLKR